MVFANVLDNPDLHDYVKRLRRALSDNDIDFDRKKFMSHITLVRRASGNREFPIQTDAEIEETMRVKGISLMKSEQGKHGMIYTEIGYVRAF
jgi:2'-5' RNA ligase